MILFVFCYSILPHSSKCVKSFIAVKLYKPFNRLFCIYTKNRIIKVDVNTLLC